MKPKTIQKKRNVRTKVKRITIGGIKSKPQTARTTAGVERALRKRNPRPVLRRMNPYAHCRLSPFTSGGGALLPDGSAGRAIVIDHRAYSTITSGTGAYINLKVTPSFPTPLYVKCASTLPNSCTANGVAISQTVTGLDTTSNWVAATAYTEGNLNPPINPAATVNLPLPMFGATKARIISQAWRVIYTGPASTAQGLITINNSPASINEAPMYNEGISILGPNDATVQAYAIGSQAELVNVHSLLTAVQPGAYQLDTVTLRPEMGAQGVLRHSKPTYPFVTYQNNPIVLMDKSRQLNNGGSIVSWNGYNSTYGGLLNFWDDGWDPVDIMLSTASGLSYRVEVSTCIEYLVDPSSSISKLTLERPMTDLRTIQMTESAIRGSPIATPLGDDSLMKRYMQAFSSASGALAMLPGNAGLTASLLAAATGAASAMM